jgi:hypothetical protein
MISETEKRRYVEECEEHLIEVWGEAEYFRRLNEVSVSVLEHMQKKFPNIAVGLSVIVLDTMSCRMIEKSTAK